MQIIPESYLNNRTLITGDVNSGKTHLTQSIMLGLVQAGYGPEIVLLDLAPVTTRGIGGKMTPQSKDTLLLTCRILPPRLTGKDENEIQRLAEQNAQKIDPLMDRAMASKRTILIINDASMYMQAGSIARFNSMISAFPTVIINAYYGNSFKPAPFTNTEQKNVESLYALCDQVTRL